MADVRMGESDIVMEYDENAIFRHMYVPSTPSGHVS